VQGRKHAENRITLQADKGKLKLSVMTKISITAILAAAIILLAAGRHPLPQTRLSAPLVTDSLAPQLPDIPFDYTDILIPNYVLQSTDPSNTPFLPLLDSITNAGAALGRVLFYEKRLSANRQISCGSCHAQALSFGAGTSGSPGFAGVVTPRNTMHINQLVFSPGAAVFWDGRVQTIHQQVIMPILHPDEMGLTEPEIVARIQETAYYEPLFEAAYGDTEVTLDRVRSALVQFVVSMVSFQTKFDQMQESGDLNALTPIEQQGWLLFQQSCVLCHIEGHFGTDSLFNIGLEMEYSDPGLAGWTGNPADHGAFKSPTLRNIAHAAPYMHDGRLATLEDVVNFYSDEVVAHPNNHIAEMLDLPLPFRGFRYSDDEKAALVAFMHALTDTVLLTHPKWSDPFVPITNLVESTDDEALQWVVSPNPATHEVLVSWSATAFPTAKISLKNLNGQVLQSYRANGGSHRIHLNGLPAGVYVLALHSGKRQATRLLLVKPD
jgi:cytochrome c peroxidase